jgi:site-specific DNA recombinase
MTRAALYLRQSQHHDGSISEELQETTARAMCEREGWEVVGVYKDIDISGTSTTNRPGLRALRAAYDRGEFDKAVAHAASRFARNMKDGAEIVAEMPIATVLEGEAPPDDDFMPLLHMLLAHKQSKEIGKRWREVQAHKVAQGLPATGRARFGYLYTEKRYEVDKSLRAVVVEVYRRYTEGAGWHSLAADLNERGYRTPRAADKPDGTPGRGGFEWSTTTLRKFCDSGFAAGKIVVRGEFLDGAHEALITEREWELYLAKRKARAVHAPRSQTVPWFLSRLVFCGLCGKGLVSSGRKKYPSVSCPARTKTGGCPGVHVSRPGLEELVAKWLGGHVDAWAAAMPDYSAERQAAEATLETREAALSELEAKKGVLARLLVDGVLDQPAYQGARADLDAEIATAAEARDAALSAVGAFVPEGADVYERLAMPEVSTGEWNGLLSRILRGVIVCKDRVIFVPFVSNVVDQWDRPPRRSNIVE